VVQQLPWALKVANGLFHLKRLLFALLVLPHSNISSQNSLISY